MYISNSLIISKKGLEIFLIIRLSNLRDNDIKVDSRVIGHHKADENIDS